MVTAGMEEQAEETKSAVRIFVGGLGQAVSAEDLRSLFASLGTVKEVQTIRTKGRSFAYLDFLADPKSLSKLFSKYNGCLWKGGRLKLEKAKEDYLVRLKREREQDAPDDATKPPPTAAPEEMPNATHTSKSNTKHLQIFFPRLRKVKSIPFSGTGKHKYSFQNIKVPPLPVHFCDCEEHCSPFVTEREKLSIEKAAESGGMNDEEISIMNAVMNKLFEKEKASNAKNLGEQKDSFDSPDALHSDECEDSATDEDDLIINMETKKNKTALIGNQELERILENQETWLNKTKIAKEEPNKSMPRVSKRSNSNPDKNKKRKSLSKLEVESNGEVSTAPRGKSNMQTLPDEVGSGAQPTELEDGELTKVSWSQKSSWRELLGDGGNTAFSASLILPKLDSRKNQQRSDDLCSPVSTNNKTENMEMDACLGSKPANTQVIKELAEAQPTNKQVKEDVTEHQHIVTPKKTGRGASWLQKQSWTQLVRESNNLFSISHILPGITFPEPTAKEPIVEPANSNDCNHNGVAKDTINEVIRDGFNSREHIGANDIASASVAEEKVETSPMERSTENVEIGETCSFMRSTASLKEWAKAKAAVSGSLKRKRVQADESESDIKSGSDQSHWEPV
ncbi:Nucleolar protein 8 [Mucuna pruriens]|uniref:Nucleolar protein 8 n=1 Tax=Mucuna pruriens TaxID=157652 RepID=A0A371E9F4_MUCPR|nr:Nucleolar protein 8 [Mucuna pruriens]